MAKSKVLYRMVRGSHNIRVKGQPDRLIRNGDTFYPTPKQKEKFMREGRIEIVASISHIKKAVEKEETKDPQKRVDASKSDDTDENTKSSHSVDEFTSVAAFEMWEEADEPMLGDPHGKNDTKFNVKDVKAAIVAAETLNEEK